MSKTDSLFIAKNVAARVPRLADRCMYTQIAWNDIQFILYSRKIQLKY